MATVVGFPIPADQLGPLAPLIEAVLFGLQTHMAVTVLLLYDYFLTLDDEIEFIWKRLSWNSSTVLYLLLRYFGTLYNLTATVFMFIPATDNTYDSFDSDYENSYILLINKAAGQFVLGADSWAGSVIWWMVQVILLLRLYALYGCSKRLLVLMVTFFAAEVSTMLWILIGTSLLRSGTFAEHVYVTGYYYNDVELCFGEVVPAYGHIWVPSFIFDAILAILAVWAGIQHSRRQSYAHSRFNKSRLVDVLIHGNVVYFISPLVTFILLLKAGVSQEVTWFADTLLFRAPVAISAGCRLILSIRQVTSSSTTKQYSSMSTWGTSSTAVAGASTSQGP
ncbi:hypothetical protein SCLCIDRAFT_28912 [Scleroderma citrinum Foug A]|uniref:DUF6533 domain-containing protein n=1 Tax=Scleroderma citrinum Foug A TaxID=1036808 RepID=A0A0C2ZXW9_9AGAM|nr:hypothetical protein SCLCIDRAFT_28912 [Scleroderma citrinum Foug A]